MFSLVQQCIFLTLGAMILDGGQAFQVVAYAALAYWGGFVIIMVRRRHQLTPTDKILIRWGYMMLWIVSAFVTGYVWHLRGYWVVKPPPTSVSYYLCWFVLPIFLTCCGSAYLTGLMCRFAKWRHWKVGLYFGIIGAVVAGTLTVLFIWLGLHGVGKIDEREFFQSMFLRVIPFALPAALVVAWRYRRNSTYVEQVV